MKYSLCFAASLLLLAGCQNDRPTASQEEIIRQLDAINISLNRLGEILEKSRKQESNDIIRNRAFEADPAKLAAIPPLPEKPTDGQILSYIAAIKAASADQNSFSANQPQVALYRKIGPGHLKLLLPEISQSASNYHLLCALPDLVGPADKEFALATLPEVPNLLIPVLKNGWGDEAKKGVFAALSNNRSYMIQDQKKAILALAKNDEDRKQLIQAFLAQPNLLFLFEDLAGMPDVNGTELINQAWERQRFNSQNWSLPQLGLQAARRGNIEALGYLINKFCTRTPSDHLSDDIIIFLAAATGQPLQAEKLQNWYSENRDKLVFDPATKRYQVKK